MATNPAGFRAVVEPMIMDGYLDTKEEINCMMRAAEFGLSGKEAEAVLVEACQKHGARIERLSKQRFKDEVRSRVGDKFLDGDEYDDLVQSGLEMFEGAEDPMELVDGCIREMLAKERATTEKHVREDMNRRLEAIKVQGPNIEPEVWGRLRSGALEQVAKLGVNMEENDIGAVLDDCLRSSGLQLRRSRGPLLAVAAVAVFAFGVLLLGLVAFVFWPDSPAPSATTSSAGSAAVAAAGNVPSCDATCKAEIEEYARKLTIAADGRKYTTPPEDCVKKWNAALRARCEPYDRLSPSDKGAAVASESTWSWCATDNSAVLRRVVDDYLRWAQDKDGGKSTCEWLRRCLEAIPDNEPCTAAGQSASCGFAGG